MYLHYVCFIYASRLEERRMAKWTTISLRKELIREVRRNLEIGHYRSISEFISEAVRHRLEELSRSKGYATTVYDFPFQPTEIAGVEKHPDVVADRLEQVWAVLVGFLEDLTHQNLKVNVEIAAELRYCKTLINFVRAHSCPGCDTGIVGDKLRDLERGLAKTKADLIGVALTVSENYTKEWVRRIGEAERGDLNIVTSPASNFVLGLPRNPETKWMRLTLSKPITEEKAQEISKQFSVITEVDNNGSRIVVRGNEASIKKALQALQRLGHLNWAPQLVKS